MPATIGRRELISALGSAAIVGSNTVRAEETRVTHQPTAKKRMAVASSHRKEDISPSMGESSALRRLVAAPVRV